MALGCDASLILKVYEGIRQSKLKKKRKEKIQKLRNRARSYINSY